MFLDLAVKGIEIFFHFLLDIRRELPGKIFQSIPAFIGQPIVGTVGLGRHFYQICFHQFGNRLLELEIIGVLPVQDKIGNLRVGKISLRILQHI